MVARAGVMVTGLLAVLGFAAAAQAAGVRSDCRFNTGHVRLEGRHGLLAVLSGVLLDDGIDFAL